MEANLNRTRTTSRPWRALAAAALAFAAFASDSLAGPPPGTIISNQATGTATAGVTPLTANSNAVTLTTGSAVVGLGATLVSSADITTPAGTTVVFRHTLSNVGTVPDTYTLTATDANSTFTFTSVAMYPDANGDGVADSGTPVASPVALNAGQSLRFVVVAQVPAGVSSGVSNAITVTAVSLGGAPIPSNIDRVTIFATAGVADCATVQKMLSRDRGLSPFAPLTVGLTYTPCNRARERVVIMDPLPAGMRYLAGSGRWSGAPGLALTDAGGDRQGTGATQIEYDFGVTMAGQVTATVLNIAADQGGWVEFDVEIVPGLAVGTVVSNSAAYVFSDASGNPGGRMQANTATYTVTGNADLELTGERLPTAMPGATVTFNNILTNRGSAADRFDITLAGSTFPAGTTFALFQPDGVTPLADTDGNGTPDTGLVAANASYRIVVKATIPATALPAAYKVTKTARSALSPMRFASADDAVDTLATKCATVLDPDNQATIGRGQHVTYTHYINNRGNCDEDLTVALGYIANDQPGWTAQAFVDNPVGGGASVVGSLDPTDTPIVQSWTVRLPAGGKLRVLVDVRAPTAEEEAQARAVKSAKATIGSNTTTLTVIAGSTGGLTVRDTTLIDDQAGPVQPQNVIRNFTDASYGVPTGTAVVGRSLYLQANAASCNAQPGAVDTRTVVITGPGGEVQVATATETGPNTGIFNVPALPVRAPPVVANDGTLQGRSGDAFEIDLQGCGRTIATAVTLITPVGVVFDSANNLPVAAARVTLLSATPTACGTTVVTEGTTGADGRYSFAAPASGWYCLSVQPPNGYSFASKVPWTQLTSGRNLAVTGATSGGSYGNGFQVTDGMVVVDIPVDATAQDGLFVQKQASRAVAEVGEFIDYSVRVRNATGNALDRASVVLVDNLPAGFAYIKGTARRDGAALPDPVGGNGPRLALDLGTMASAQEIEVRYRVRVGPGSLQGDGINRAQATYTAAGATTNSNVATAKVVVIGGVFSERGYILGKVYLDCNVNGVQDKGEAGVPGVRLFIEDGTFVITDGEGKYSFYGISNRTHVLKVDRVTLPPGAKLAVTGTRNLGSAGSRIVDLKSGELHRGDFAVAGCEPAVVEDVKARAKALSQGLDALLGLAGTQLAHEAPTAVDVKGLPASGVISTPGQPGGAVPSLTAPVGTTNTSSLSTATERIAPVRSTADAAPKQGHVNGDNGGTPLEELLPKLDNKLGFVGLADGDVLAQAQTTVRVKGTAGSTFKLTVNGVEVSEKRVGKRATLAQTQAQAWEYIGIDLRAGENEITVAQVDSFGNPRGTQTVRVKASGRAAKIAIELPAGGAIADGRSVAKIVVRILDEAGLPVGARTPVTLEATRGQWNVTDPDPQQDGVQVFVEGGRGEFGLAAPMEPGSARIAVTSGTLRVEDRLDFLPELRSLIAAGVLEGVVNIRNINTKALVPAREADGFEQELRHVSKEFDDGKGQAGARAAFFLKGKIKGDFLLTAAYDSDKDSRERLFRDIQPDEFYPVYGDSAIRGYDAQSTSKLYVRVDKDRSYLLWGDLTTAPDGNGFVQRRLSGYSRSLTGAKGHYENGRVVANVFASKDNTRQVIDEIRANGTSGPYQIGSNGALINSEKVEILVRDRNQPSIVLDARAQSRFTDYEIDGLTGRILFRSPVPSLDRDLNPISIRVTYEVVQGGEEFWVAGGDVTVRVTENIEVGASYVKDKNPLDPFEMKGAHAAVRVTESTVVSAEYAQTDRPLAPNANGSTKGDAARIEIKHKSKFLEAEAFVAQSDAGFDNPGAAVSRGRGEAGVKAQVPLGEKTRLRVEALRTEDRVTDGRRDGAEAVVEHTFGNDLRVEAGVRHARETTTPALPTYPNDQNQGSAGTTPNEVTSVRAKVSGPLPFVKDATIYGELEMDVEDSDKKIAAIGGEYVLPGRGRVYARHEFISSLTGPYGLNATQRQNSTIVGVDTEYMRDGKLFSEYRIRDALSGGDAEAAIGLRNLWTLAPGLRLGTNFERVEALSGKGETESTALALAIEYTANPLWKGTARIELRDGATSDSVLSTVGVAAKLSPDWTLLARNTYALTKNEGENAGSRTIDRMQAGVAYRDSEFDRWNGLARIEHRLEEDTTQRGISLKRTTDLISLHADWKPSRPFLVTGRYAAKWTTDKSEGITAKYRAQLIGGRATWEFAPKWDVALVANMLFGDSTASRQYGVGLEVGYLFATNLWVSAGYNFTGFRDEDLAGANYTAKGAYVRMRYKFDESLLEMFEPAAKAAPAAGAAQ